MPLKHVVERDPVPDQSFALIDQQPQLRLGPVSCVAASCCRPWRSAARARATGSMPSGCPRVRAPRRLGVRLQDLRDGGVARSL